MEEALIQAQCCAVFVVSGEDGVKGWQNEQLRSAIQTRVEDQANYRVIPVLLLGARGQAGALCRRSCGATSLSSFSRLTTSSHSNGCWRAYSACADLMSKAVLPQGQYRP